MLSLLVNIEGKEIQASLLTSPKNASYLFLQYIAKTIEITDFRKMPIISTKTNDTTFIEQFSVYVIFSHNIVHIVILLHFSSLIPNKRYFVCFLE